MRALHFLGRVRWRSGGRVGLVWDWDWEFISCDIRWMGTGLHIRFMDGVGGQDFLIRIFEVAFNSIVLPTLPLEYLVFPKKNLCRCALDELVARVWGERGR